jgi:ribonucrease Y
VHDLLVALLGVVVVGLAAAVWRLSSMLRRLRSAGRSAAGEARSALGGHRSAVSGADQEPGPDLSTRAGTVDRSSGVDSGSAGSDRSLGSDRYAGSARPGHAGPARSADGTIPGPVSARDGAAGSTGTGTGAGDAPEPVVPAAGGADGGHLTGGALAVGSALAESVSGEADRAGLDGPQAARMAGSVDGRPGAGAVAVRGPGALTVPELEELRAQARRDVEREMSDMRAQAVQAATSVRSEAETLATFTRSMAETEAATLRRTVDNEIENTRRAVQAESENARRQAALEASTLVLDARRQAEQEAAAITERARAAQADVERREGRLVDREHRLDEQHRRLEQRDTELTAAQRALEAREAETAAAAAGIQAELERVSGLTAADAKTELLKAVEAQCRRDAAIIVRDIEAEARQNAEQRARHIVVDAIQRVASEQTAESVVSVLHLPGDEMKGRIIGREGRNIRAFESVTGVNLIIDDTPEAVLLSCFDPVRREIGRLTLEKLVLDGRIHPQRIEEVHERSREEVERLCLKAGEDALVEVGITELHPEMIKLLGRLRYRTSYGQNVLKHLIETAHIAGIMAAELRMDPSVLKRSAFLHDIGKALTHEVEGSHALIGADLARKYGESEEVVHAIEAHHNEVLPQTIEAVLTQAADSCSGGRPGARRESLEAYVKRLERIEEIASGKPGVDRVFAMQAGREIRVIVQPEQVDDVTAHLLAREVAKQIEDELTYPGQIRVTVVRESRATEIAR